MVTKTPMSGKKSVNEILEDVVSAEPTINIPVEGEARVEVETVDNPETVDFDELAFNEEVLQIYVQEPQDENAARLIPIRVNNSVHHVLPGKVISIKRKFVEVLAGAKNVTYKQIVKTDQAGEPINKMVPRMVMVHNFTVVSDPNPRGPAWLKSILERAV